MHATPIKILSSLRVHSFTFYGGQATSFFFLHLKKMIVWVGVVYGICRQHAALIRRLYYIFRCFHFLINYVIMLYRLQAPACQCTRHNRSRIYGFDDQRKRCLSLVAATNDELSSTLSLVGRNGSVVVRWTAIHICGWHRHWTWNHEDRLQPVLRNSIRCTDDRNHCSSLRILGMLKNTKKNWSNQIQSICDNSVNLWCRQLTQMTMPSIVVAETMIFHWHLIDVTIA